jgi:hypothetical protein
LVVVRFLHCAQELMSRAIQHRKALALADTQDVPRVVGLAPGEEKAHPLALFRRQIEAMHGG